MIFFKTAEKQAAICNQDYMDIYTFTNSKNKIIQNSCTTFFLGGRALIRKSWIVKGYSNIV